MNIYAHRCHTSFLLSAKYIMHLNAKLSFMIPVQHIGRSENFKRHAKSSSLQVHHTDLRPTESTVHDLAFTKPIVTFPFFRPSPYPMSI